MRIVVKYYQLNGKVKVSAVHRQRRFDQNLRKKRNFSNRKAVNSDSPPPRTSTILSHRQHPNKSLCSQNCPCPRPPHLYRPETSQDIPDPLFEMTINPTYLAQRTRSCMSNVFARRGPFEIAATSMDGLDVMVADLTDW